MKSIDDLKKDDAETFQDLKKSLSKKAAKNRELLLNGNISKLPVEATRQELLSFVKHFIPSVGSVALFHDDKLISKLRDYRFSQAVFKWFTPLDEILDEIERISNIENLFIPKTHFLFASMTYIENKVHIAIIESFGLEVKHGRNEESNILHKNVDNLYRKRDYNSKLGQMGRMTPSEFIINVFFDKVESMLKDEIDFKKLLLNASKGDFSESKELFKTYGSLELSKNKIYLEFFPLFKLVFKDREMESDFEFDERPNIVYDGNYNKYKISRVKKILHSK